MASAECPICGKAIGYEVDFYFDDGNDGKPTHALCLDAKIEKERG
jgi:hypothetical protein